MTKREQARYRAITRQLARMLARGWTADTHPDFEILEQELAELGRKLTEQPAAGLLK